MDDTMRRPHGSICGVSAPSSVRYGEVLIEATALLGTARLTAVEGAARAFADAVYDDPTPVHVWSATRKYRAPDQRGGVAATDPRGGVDRLQQLRWALEQRCLGCGCEFVASPHYGVRKDGRRGDVLCAPCGAREESDRLRRGLHAFVLELRDAWAPPRRNA